MQILGRAGLVGWTIRRVLAPVEVTDPNGNASEVQFDALGRVEAVALRGKNGEGDTLAEPTASFVYDAQAWVERGEAVSVRQRLRRQHGAANDGFEARVEYMDGGGNAGQTHQKTKNIKDFDHRLAIGRDC